MDHGDHGNAVTLINAHVVEFVYTRNFFGSKQEEPGVEKKAMEEGGGDIPPLGEEEQGEVSRSSSCK